MIDLGEQQVGAGSVSAQGVGASLVSAQVYKWAERSPTFTIPRASCANCPRFHNINWKV